MSPRLIERQKRQDISGILTIDDDLFGAAQDALHRLAALAAGLPIGLVLAILASEEAPWFALASFPTIPECEDFSDTREERQGQFRAADPIQHRIPISPQKRAPR